MTKAFSDAILANHLAIVGKSGSGKTSTAKLLIEQVVADGYRVCIADPIKSDYWGLTSSASGKRAGLPFRILGGPKQHVPLPPESGKAIGALVASGALPLSILDMADFGAGDSSHFFVDFADALLKNMTGVLFLVIDEAHEFAPKERSGIGKESMAIHWAKKLATAGRSKGIRLVVMTQRTQKLHNDLLACETIIAHRLFSPADRAPVMRWMDDNLDAAEAANVESSLKRLETGEAWIVSGESDICERRKFPKFATFDNSKTPEKGDIDPGAVTRAAVNIDELTALVGESVREAAANDPKKLRDRVADLERQLSIASSTPQVEKPA